MSGAGGQPVAPTSQPTATPVTAVPTTAAEPKKKTKAQTTLNFTKKTTGTGGVSRPALSVSLSERTGVTRTALSTVADAARSSPSKIIVGWISEGITTRTKLGKEAVTVFADGPPMEYYVQHGLRKQKPKTQLQCIALKMMHVLQDGRERRQRGGKGMLCGNCFALLRMPQFGEENLRCHLASSACGAGEWSKNSSLRRSTRRGRRRMTGGAWSLRRTVAYSMSRPKCGSTLRQRSCTLVLARCPHLSLTTSFSIN